jgi:hypothetical protein
MRQIPFRMLALLLADRRRNIKMTTGFKELELQRRFPLHPYNGFQETPTEAVPCAPGFLRELPAFPFRETAFPLMPVFMFGSQLPATFLGYKICRYISFYGTNTVRLCQSFDYIFHI